MRFAEPNGAEALIPLDSTHLPPPVVVVEIPPIILPFAFSAPAPTAILFFSEKKSASIFVFSSDYSSVRCMNDKKTRLFVRMSENR